MNDQKLYRYIGGMSKEARRRSKPFTECCRGAGKWSYEIYSKQYLYREPSQEHEVCLLCYGFVENSHAHFIKCHNDKDCTGGKWWCSRCQKTVEDEDHINKRSHKGVVTSRSFYCFTCRESYKFADIRSGDAIQAEVCLREHVTKTHRACSDPPPHSPGERGLDKTPPVYLKSFLGGCKKDGLYLNRRWFYLFGRCDDHSLFGGRGFFTVTTGCVKSGRVSCCRLCKYPESCAVGMKGVVDNNFTYSDYLVPLFEEHATEYNPTVFPDEPSVPLPAVITKAVWKTLSEDEQDQYVLSAGVARLSVD